MPVLAYCATLNNYTPEDVAVLRTPNSRLAYIVVGHEMGENGTPHLQIYFQLEKQTKLSTIKNWGGPWAKMHLESARGTDVEASDYCKKDGHYFEVGSCKSMGRAGQRNDLLSLKQAIRDGATYDVLLETHFETCAMYSRFVKDVLKQEAMNKELALLREDLQSSLLRPWQKALLDVVSEDPHPRRIYWMWENKGNVGKSWMAKYLMAMKDAILLTPGKKADMAYIYSQKPSKIVIFDLSRTTAPSEDRNYTLDSVYSLAEDIKNGMVTSYKYDSCNVLSRGTHVVVFANFEPDLTKWSSDRYFIKCL